MGVSVSDLKVGQVYKRIGYYEFKPFVITSITDNKVYTKTLNSKLTHTRSLNNFKRNIDIGVFKLVCNFDKELEAL